jgi:replicative DNA helicase
MAKIDNQFITRLIRHPDEDWLSCGVTSDMVSLDARPVYEFIRKEATSYKGSVPTMETVKQFFPAFRSRKAPENTEFYARVIIRRFTERQVKESAAKLAEALSAEEPDLEEAGKILTEGAAQLSLIHSGRVQITRYGISPTERLEALKKAQHVQADFSLGHKLLDEDLIGAERGDFYIIAGTPAAGKTWFLLKTLYNLWRSGLNILLFSFELSRKLIMRRLDAIVAQIQYNRFRRGLLTDDEWRLFQRRLMFNSKLPSFFEVLTAEASDPTAKVGGPGRLDYVYGKIRQYNPDIVGIDGFYLMHGVGNSDWERMASLTRGFHGVTQATGVNGWATTQLTKTSDEKNPKIRDLSFSWTFAQDTDGAFLLSRPENSFPIMNVGKFREAEDQMRYAIKFNPGAEIEVERMAPVIENPLMD